MLVRAEGSGIGFPVHPCAEYQPEYVQEWSSKGLILELGDLIDEYAPNYRELTSESVQAWGLYNGGEYAIVDQRSETAVLNRMMYIRQDWLDNLGLEIPTTFDELLEVIRAFTEDDPDGNGENDTYYANKRRENGFEKPFDGYNPYSALTDGAKATANSLKAGFAGAVGNTAGIDYSSMGNMVEGALRNMAVVIDGRTAGRLLAQPVNDALGTIATRRV